ncbi:enterochelin esterase domain-containing protein [Austwickia chelonae]|uniref:enterochelin esterase domain-containing protein n=1 Tax=Austwickia chelonae TaxID=100225 RepID=UPI000E2553C2|nr:enterochelin esterase domain-containing protein [Austwickia chelonae]
MRRTAEQSCWAPGSAPDRELVAAPLGPGSRPLTPADLDTVDDVTVLREVGGRSGREVLLIGGVRHHPVIFRYPDQAGPVMLHLNGLTDRHRARADLAFLDEGQLTYLLPADGTWSYRFVAAADMPHGDLPADVGATRPGWLAVHAAGRPDPANPESIPDFRGGYRSSVHTGPAACIHPAWADTDTGGRLVIELTFPVGLPPAGPAVGSTDLRTPYGDNMRTCYLSPAAGPDAPVLIVLDGRMWYWLGLPVALDRRGGRRPHLLMVDSGSLDQRAADLPHPERVGAVVAAALAATAPLIGVHDPSRTLVCGQSFGGLAAAGLLVHRSDLVSAAVAQSGSFWFAPGREPRRDDPTPGVLLEEVRALAEAGETLPGRRLVVQVGTDEDDMVLLSRACRDTLRFAGVDVTHREYRGGHDYAWWRHGLLHALDELDGIAP